jgi:hypothetical protein
MSTSIREVGLPSNVPNAPTPNSHVALRAFWSAHRSAQEFFEGTFPSLVMTTIDFGGRTNGSPVWKVAKRNADHPWEGSTGASKGKEMPGEVHQESQSTGWKGLGAPINLGKTFPIIEGYMMTLEQLWYWSNIELLNNLTEKDLTKEDLAEPEYQYRVFIPLPLVAQGLHVAERMVLIIAVLKQLTGYNIEGVLCFSRKDKTSMRNFIASR